MVNTYVKNTLPTTLSGYKKKGSHILPEEPHVLIHKNKYSTTKLSGLNDDEITIEGIMMRGTAVLIYSSSDCLGS